MNNGLPQGWSPIRLEDLVSARKGKKSRTERDAPSNGFIPYLDIQAIEKGEVSSYAEAASSRLGTADDILVVWDGARSGWAGLGREGAIGSTIMALKPRAGDHTYLYRWLQTQFEHVNSKTRGTGIPHVDPEVFWKLDVPFAPLNEQRRIVAKLGKLLEKVDACQQRMAKIPVLLKRFRQSVLAASYSGRLTADWRETEGVTESAKEFLEHVHRLRLKTWSAKQIGKTNRKYPEPASIDSNNLSDIPESWEWASADAICSQVTDGEHIQPPYQSEGHPMLSAKHVRDGYVTLEAAGLISNSDFNKALDRCQPVNGDIVIVSVGATTGRSALVENCPPFAIVRSVLLLKPLISAKFLFRWLQSPWCFRWMTQASGASAQPHLYIKDTKKMPVPVPPPAEQQEIVRRVEALFALADQIEARCVKAKSHVEKLTQSILAKAFRGELVPQDPTDEPASILLERIKAQKPTRNLASKATRRRRSQLLTP